MTNWEKETSIDVKNKLVLFLISPFLSFVYSLRRMNTRSSYLIFYLFALFFGLSFTNEQGGSEKGSLDSARYIEHFERYENQVFDEILKFKDDDYYFDYITYYLQYITDNYHILFMIFAAVFAFFQLKSLKYLTQENEFANNWYCFFLAYLFAFNGIFNINGVRFWTAAWVAVFCFFKIYRDNDKRYLLLLLTTPLIHLSYWTVIGVTVLTFFTKKFEKVWIIMLFISFIYSNVAFTIATENASLLPAPIAEKLMIYTSESVMKHEARTGSGFWWVPRAFTYIKQIYLITALILIIKNRKSVLSDIRSKNLYLATLVWMSFCNFGMSIPSLGRRYIILAYPLIAYLMLVTFKGSKYKKFIYLLPFVFFHDILFSQFSNYTTVLDNSFFLSNPFYLIYKYVIVPL